VREWLSVAPADWLARGPITMAKPGDSIHIHQANDGCNRYAVPGSPLALSTGRRELCRKPDGVDLRDCLKRP
jgi:hypothetical protein